MDDTGKEIAIDIGGGYGEYFVERAKNEPHKNFIILEPMPLCLPNRPPNLHIIRWKDNENSALPFKPESVDEVNINYLFGKMDSSRLERCLLQIDPKEIYRRLIQDVQTVLKPGGKIFIVDANRHINSIKEMLIKVGYRVTQQPVPLPDPKTYWSRKFAEKYQSDRESFIQPMTIEAQK